MRGKYVGIKGKENAGVYQAGSREYAPPRTERSKARFVTVTGVKLTGDLREATVYVSLLDKKKRERISHGLNKSKGFIRKELGTRLKVYYTPEISFEEDKSLDYGMHIEGLLKKIHEEDGNGN